MVEVDVYDRNETSEKNLYKENGYQEIISPVKNGFVERNHVDNVSSSGSFNGFLLAIAVGCILVVMVLVCAVFSIGWMRSKKKKKRFVDSEFKHSNSRICSDYSEKSSSQNGGSIQSGKSAGLPGQTIFSPKPQRTCVVVQQAPPSVGPASTLQKEAWETMLHKQPDIVDARPASVSDLPPPPDFLLDGDMVVYKDAGLECIINGDQLDGYQCGESVDDDIDSIDFTIRVPSICGQPWLHSFINQSYSCISNVFKCCEKSNFSSDDNFLIPK